MTAQINNTNSNILESANQLYKIPFPIDSQEHIPSCSGLITVAQYGFTQLYFVSETRMTFV